MNDIIVTGYPNASVQHLDNQTTMVRLFDAFKAAGLKVSGSTDYFTAEGTATTFVFQVEEVGR